MSQKDEETTLKTLMEEAGLKEQELSHRLGVGLRIIGHWKKRGKMPTLKNAVGLARELGVSLKTLAQSMGIDVSGVPDDNDDCNKL
jgi:transcriptional regulator with XRE-family HTH domain